MVERYRDSVSNLPPIAVARDGVLVDGYHRWQAHVREEIEMIRVENLGDLTDAEIFRESIKRNSTHGQQLSRDEKKPLAARLWLVSSDMPVPERTQEIAKLLSVSRDAVERWTKDARKAEKLAQQEKAWDLWLDCCTQEQIAEQIGVSQPTINDWLSEIRKRGNLIEPPGSRLDAKTGQMDRGSIQDFDIWNFATKDRDAGQQSYFGSMPPQVMENLLWFFTEPGQIVVDLFAGSGTTVDVAKAMGRRVWASDIRGDHYSPHLPIHQHDVTTGWPEDAPATADLVFLDPPYWQQAKGRYSSEATELADMDLLAFYAAWTALVAAIGERSARIAYIISPTQFTEGGSVIDHATDMLRPLVSAGWHVERRVIVPYTTQQATGYQVTDFREKKQLLNLYRDLVVVTR